MTLELVGMTSDDVAEARRQAAVCNVDHELVQRVLSAFIEGFGLEPSGPEWSPGDMATLLEALGMLPAWTSAVDVELASLLRAADAAQGGGGDV